MSVLDQFRRKKPTINDNYRITQVGENKLDTAFDGDIRSNVLVILKTGGTLSVKEVASQANISPAKAEKVLQYLEHNNYVQNVSNASPMAGDE